MSVRKTTGTGRKVVFQTLKGGVTSTAVEQAISGTGSVTLKLERTADNKFTGSYDVGAGLVGGVGSFFTSFFVVGFRLILNISSSSLSPNIAFLLY
jgi:hypothetical protein